MMLGQTAKVRGDTHVKDGGFGADKRPWGKSPIFDEIAQAVVGVHCGDKAAYW